MLLKKINPRERIKKLRARRLVDRMRYGLRYKHRSGHSIHSPYVFNLVRAVFMRKLSSDINPNFDLSQQVYKLGVNYKLACRVGQFASYNNFTLFAINPKEYHGEEIIVLSHIDENTIAIIEQLKNSAHERKALVITNIYKHKECREWWQMQHELMLDIYHIGIVIYDKDLNKQYFKLKI